MQHIISRLKQLLSERFSKRCKVRDMISDSELRHLLSYEAALLAEQEQIEFGEALGKLETAAPQGASHARAT